MRVPDALYRPGAFGFGGHG